MALSGTRRLFSHGLVALALAVAVGACAKKPPTTPGAATPGSPQDFAQNVGDRVLFTVDSSQINPQAAAILERQAAWLQRYPRYQITMEGHADERGTREYNIALSARRADAAKNFLTARGIPASRLRTLSFGKE
ncbi:MAG: OmpA family protein, partial [Pseudomonadota bacterium]